VTSPKPRIDITTDGHVHTRLCRHATGEMEEYVLAGIDRGLAKMVFLEHLEAGINYFDRTWLTEEDFEEYFREGTRLQSRYHKQIEVGLGVEVGYNRQGRAELRKKLAAHPWERVGISCHFLPIAGSGLHINLLSRLQQNIDIAREVGIDQLLSRYFDTLHEAVTELPGTVLCHLDAALRHVPDLAFTDRHIEQIDHLLATVKARGMAIEINTSGFTMRGEPFPARPYLAMAVSHDIPLVAGSDAHRPEDVGRFFHDLPDYITSAVCP